MSLSRAPLDDLQCARGSPDGELNVVRIHTLHINREASDILDGSYRFLLKDRRP